MAKVYVSEKQIVSINEFMENYVGKRYDGREKLTHQTMTYYLNEEGYRTPNQVDFKKVTKEKLLRGEYIVVKDVCNKIMIYINPRKSLDSLYKELNTKKSKELIKKNREELIKSLKDEKEKLTHQNHKQKKQFAKIKK